MVRERTAHALAEARRQNKLVGRPSRVTAEQYRHIHTMSAAGADYRTISATVGLSRSIVGRVIRREIASLEAQHHHEN